MRRLATNQSVRVDLDAKVDWQAADSIDCRVQAVHGPVATLAPIGELSTELRERLASGSLCFLTFTHGHAPVALRGATLAVADSKLLEFVVIDGIQVAERRSAERTPLIAALRAAPVGADGKVGEWVSTVTSNLSMGGALILKRPGLCGGSRFKLELFLPGDPQHVHCEAVLARETATHLGVRMTGVSEADHLRIASVLAAQRRVPALV